MRFDGTGDDERTVSRNMVASVGVLPTLPTIPGFFLKKFVAWFWWGVTKRIRKYLKKFSKSDRIVYK